MELINKQAAIDALYHVDEYNARSIETIRNLPSVQQKIIHCKDCKHYWVHRCMDSIPIEICDLNQTFYDAEVDFCSLADMKGEQE